MGWVRLARARLALLSVQFVRVRGAPILVARFAHKNPEGLRPVKSSRGTQLPLAFGKREIEVLFSPCASNWRGKRCMPAPQACLLSKMLAERTASKKRLSFILFYLFWKGRFQSPPRFLGPARGGFLPFLAPPDRLAARLASAAISRCQLLHCKIRRGSYTLYYRQNHIVRVTVQSQITLERLLGR
jgi:hypothetical protein